MLQCMLSNQSVCMYIYIYIHIYIYICVYAIVPRFFFAVVGHCCSFFSSIPGFEKEPAQNKPRKKCLTSLFYGFIQFPDFKCFSLKVLALAPFQVGTLFFPSARVGWRVVNHGEKWARFQIGLLRGKVSRRAHE